MSERIIHNLLAGLLLFLISGLSAASSGHYSEYSAEKLTLTQHWKLLQVFEDTSGQLTAEELARSLDNFQYLQKMPSFGTTSSNIWFYLSADDIPSRGLLWLEFDNPYVDEVNFYHLINKPDGTDVRLVTETGDTRPFNSRQTDYRSFLFQVPLNRVDGVLLQVRGESPLLLPFSMGRPLEVFESLSLQENFILFMYGIIFAMTIYNLMVYVGTRYPQYGWYVVYMSSMATSLLFNSGYGYAYVWRDFVWLQHNIGYMAYTGFIWGGLNFTRSFLNLKKNFPVFDRYFRWFAQLPLLLIPLQFIDKAMTVSFITAGMATLTLVVLVMGLASCRRHVEAAWLFVLCWVPMMTGMLTYNLTVIGAIEGTFLRVHSAELGVAIESLMLSFALIYRLRRIEAVASRQIHDAYDKVSEALALVEKSDASKEAFLLSAGHQLKTPMHVLLGNLQLLSQQATEPDYGRLVEQSDRSATELQYKIDNLLTYSVIISGDASHRVETINLRTEFLRAREMWKHLQHKPGISIDVEFDASVPTLMAVDWIHIKKIVRIALENAIEPIESGKVTVAFSAEYRGEACRLKLIVEDNGPGMTEDLLEWYNCRDDKSHWNGSSMGMLLSRYLVEQVSGVARLSNHSHGGRFEFDCPFDEVVQDREEHLANLQGKRVLIVDDMDVNLKILAAFVRKLQADPIIVRSGQEALEYLSEDDADLILLDCLMPGLSGQDFCRLIRASKEIPSSLPVIAVSANDSDPDIESCYDAGMNDFLSKPVRLNVLKSKLEQWIPR